MTDLTKTDDIDWEDMLPKLLAFTNHLLRSMRWIRGKNSDTFLKGKEVKDYVFEAIEKYLANPEKFKPEKNRSLENYIKLHVIRRLVWNDVNSEENKTSKQIISQPDEDGVNTFEDIFPAIEATFDQQIDYEEVMAYIGKQVNGDSIVENIFMGICHFGMKRREIITELEMGDKEYNNGIRRLNTVLQTAATIFHLKARAK